MSDVLTEEELSEIEALDDVAAVRKPVSRTNIDPEQLVKDTRFNPETLDVGMMRQASLYAHYAAIASKTGQYADDIKTARDVLESKIGREIRNEAVASKTKITEKAIEDYIKLDPRWQKAAKMVNKTRADADLAKQALFALSQKRDMMVQIGVSLREEMKGEVRLMEIGLSSADIKQRALEIAGGKKTN